MNLSKTVLSLVRRKYKLWRLRTEYRQELDKGLTRALSVKIAKKHGLAGKVGYKFPDKGPMELIILSDHGKIPDLPGEFLKDFCLALCNGTSIKKKNFKNIKVVTMEKNDFQEHIKSWISYCEMADSCN